MNKKRIFSVLVLIFCAVLFCVVFSGLVTDANAQEPVETPVPLSEYGKPLTNSLNSLPPIPMPPIPDVWYRTVRHSNDLTRYWLIPVDNVVSYGGCKIREIVADCMQSNVANPPDGTLYKVRSDGYLGTGDGQYQVLKFRSKDQNCFSYIPPMVNTVLHPTPTPTPIPTPKPKCCTTCMAEFSKVENGVPIITYSRIPFVDRAVSPPNIQPNVTISYSRDQKLRLDTFCTGLECVGMWVTFGMDGARLNTNAFQSDCNGEIGCALLNYVQDKQLVCYHYPDSGCECVVCAWVTDPENSVDGYDSE